METFTTDHLFSIYPRTILAEGVSDNRLVWKIRSSARFLREIWISYFARRILEGVFVGGIVNIRNECLFFLDSWDMNRSAEQTNRTRTASRFTRFVCSALRFISHEPRKKDTHSLNDHGWNIFVSSPVKQWPRTRFECVSSFTMTAVLKSFLTCSSPWKWRLHYSTKQSLYGNFRVLSAEVLFNENRTI